jgi:hypothetical protein
MAARSEQVEGATGDGLVVFHLADVGHGARLSS